MEQQIDGAQGFESSDEDEPPHQADSESDEFYDFDEEEEDPRNFTPPSPPVPHVADEDANYVTDSEDGDSEEEEDARADQAIYDQHVETVREFVQPCPSLRTQGWATEFSFRTVAGDNVVEDVGELLQAVLRKLIRDAKANAVRQGYHGGWIGVGWGSEVMPTAFVIPYGSDIHNNARKIITAFQGWDQSAKENDLYGQILRLQVTIVDAPPAGAGRPKGSKELPKFGKDDDKGHALLEVRNKDSLCLFKAVVIAIVYLLSPRKASDKNFIRLLESPEEQTKRAKELMQNCGIAWGLPSYNVGHLKAVQDYLNQRYPEEFRILVFSADSTNRTKPVFNGGINARQQLVLWHKDGHFDAAKTPEKLLATNRNYKYCAECEVVYRGSQKHSQHCPIRCRLCLGHGHGYPRQCRSKDVTHHRECAECHHTFQTNECFERHLKAACRLFRYCQDCRYSYSVDKRTPHRCGHVRCRKCHQYALKDHQCHITAEKRKQDVDYRVVVYDVESIITDFTYGGSGALHVPNVISARVVCTCCMDNGQWEDEKYSSCEICGPKRRVVFTEWDDDDPTRAFVDPTQHFLEWLLRILNPKWKTYVYAHNGSKYDTPFVLSELYKRGSCPKLISNGLKLLQVEMERQRKAGRVVFRDSCLLFPMKLEDIPATFNVSDKVPSKPYYPYKANSRHNYGKALKGLPPDEDYLPDAMSVKKREDFKKWYSEESERRKDTLFDIRKETVEYCHNDTLQLLYGIVSFRKLVNQIATFDVFGAGITITALVMRIFKTNFMKPESLAIVPTNGYDRQSRQSTKAIKTLKYLAEVHGIEIQHRNSNGGEKQFGHYSVDGFIQHGQLQSPSFKKCARSQCYCKKADTVCRCSLCELCKLSPDDPLLANGIAIEINGCAWHGCNKPGCFVNNVNCPNGRSSDDNWSRTMKRRKDLIDDHGLFVYSIQECVIDGWLRRFVEIREAFGSYFDDGPIDPREAMFGGRVGPMRMHWERTEGSKLRARFFDINSLYPSVLADREFPIGHPTTVAHDDELCRRVRGGEYWTKKEHCPIKGILKVRVVPPKRRTIPVLPMKDDNRLLFPLCRTCSIDSRTASPFRPPGCAHGDMERSFVTTTTHVELQEALRHEYRVVDLIGYYDWPSASQSSNELFRGYIHAFVKLKEEASGWASKGIDASDSEARKKMAEYADAYRREQGIEIEIDKVEKNDGLRYVIKLFLNSLWGRFAMRTDRTKVEVVTRHSRLIDLLSTKSLEVTEITVINEKVARVAYRYKKQFETEDRNSNLVIASFTTAYGRLELFKYMCMVEESMGGTKHAFLLYGDTDSVCYVEHEDYPAIEPGRYLGEMSDEFPGKTIDEVICAGNKQYAILLRDNDTGKKSEKIKCKGITQNSETCKILTVDNMREMVDASPDDPVVLSLPLTQFGRDKQGNVYTRRVVKKNKIAYRKSWIHEKRMHPYGYDPSAPDSPPLSSNLSKTPLSLLSPPLPKLARYRPVSPTEDPNTPCCSKSLIMD